MTMYDPIEFTLGGDGGYAFGQDQVGQEDGYAILRGYTVGGGSAEADLVNPSNYTMMFVKFSWGSGDANGKLPVPRDFGHGDPNIYYKVTVQAIDSTEEE